jgi:sugar porter (SP) family MFS transporter
MNKILIKSTLAAALGGLLFGYDTVIINGAMLELVNYFELSSTMQGWTVSSALIGCILGTKLISRPGDKYGAKLLLQILAVLFFVSSVGCGVATNIESFIVYRFLGGLAIGGSSVLCANYISEISPPKHRGFLASSFQLAVVIGILMSLFTNYLLSGIGNQSWRWMLLSGAIPAVAFFLMLFVVRKSPRWLVKKGLIDEARRNIEDLSMHEIDADRTIIDIQESLNNDRESNQINIFKKPYRKIIITGIFVGAFNQLTGIGVVFYYSSQIFSIAGFSTDSAMMQSVILGITNLIFTLLAMTIIDKVGRKKLLLFGQMGMVVVLGLFGYGLLTGNIQGIWLVALLVAYIAFFASSQGVVIWVLLSEMFPNTIRVRGTSIGAFTNWIVSALLNFLFPITIGFIGISQAAQQLGLSYAFIFLSIASLIGYMYLKHYIIETKGKTLEQIEKDSIQELSL